MYKVSNNFVTETRNGTVTGISKSYIPTPVIKSKGGEVKWYDDFTREREDKRK